MKIRLYTTTLALLLLISCNKKFDHKDYDYVEIPSSCELCAFADSLNSSYRAYATGTEVPNIHDSMTISLQHIFLNTGVSLDSNVMYFNMIKFYDSNPVPDTSIVTLKNHDGVFSVMGSNFGNNVDMHIADDSLHIYHMYTNVFNPGFNILLKFDGKKIP